MRYLLVILILISCFASTGAGQDLFLVTVVSVDREKGNVYVHVADSSKSAQPPESVQLLNPGDNPKSTGSADDETGDTGADGAGIMIISGTPLADTVQPGQIMRIWGTVTGDGSTATLTLNPSSVPSMGGRDFSGVRKRLKKSLNMSGGARGMGHGRQ